MITGDRAVLMGGDGRGGGGPKVAAMMPASRAAGAGAFQVIGRGAQALVVPAAALPYLGRGLDPSLFNLTALQRVERNGQLPVRIAYRGQRPALAGVQLTSAAAGRATGYLTLATARRFGAELLRLNRADRPAGRYGTDGLFAGGLTISLGGQPGSGPARPAGSAREVVLPAQPGRPALPDRPAFKMVTLTIKGYDRFGAPDTGDMVEVSRVDGKPFTATTFFDRGIAKVSVPTGHYWAIGEFPDFFDVQHPAKDWRFAVAPQFTVAGSGATVSLSEKAAVSQIIAATPRRSVPLSTFFNLLRSPPAGPADYESFEGVNLPMWVSPTKVKPTVGRLAEFVDQQRVSPPRTRGTSYEYDIAKDVLSGLIPVQHFTARASELATVNARYFQDIKSAGELVRVGMFAQEANQLIVGFLNPFALPHHQIEYMSGNPAVQWFSAIAQTNGFSIGGQDDAQRTFLAGEHTDQNWNAYPLSPQPNVDLIGAANMDPVQPTAVRSGNTLALNLAAFSDSQPGHYGPDFGGASYRISDNGKQAAHGRLGSNGGLLAGIIAQARLSGQPSRVTVGIDATRPAKSFPLSSRVHAVWTWRTARQPRAEVPKGWTCFNSESLDVPDGGRRCAVQPMMMLHYVVAKLRLNGRTGAGRQQIAITAGQLPLARTSKITSLAVRVSVNDGKTWRPAQLRRTGPGSFLATFDAAAGSFVTLRASAADADGGSVTETIERAYQVAGGGNGHAETAGQPRRLGRVASARPRPACRAMNSRQARCFAFFAPQAAVNEAQAAGRTAKPNGWGAKSIESAYKLPVGRKVSQTVAVVEAYATPNLARSLATYRKQYGLPPCLADTGCLRIVNQKGQPGPLPQSGVPFGWDVETALDVEMVSATCPTCHILVVEANSQDLGDLGPAVRTAARLGAQAISNSYGAPENGFTQEFASSYQLTGHAVVVASGDVGFGPAFFPASQAGVVAVGGTQLTKSHTARGWTERVWNTDGIGATSSGCSAYVAKPAYQHDGHCGMRTVTDVSALAEGIAVYDQARKGWLTVDGTSAAAPIIAGVYGLAANGATSSVASLYAHPAGLFDVTKGNDVLTNGGSPAGPECGGDYLCTARAGYDGPTGLGTPDGITSF